MLIQTHDAWRSVTRCLALAMLVATGGTQAQPTSFDYLPLLRALNAARQQGCDRHPGPAGTLRQNTHLSDAAALIANGRKLDDALKETGYRAMRAAQITLRGYSGVDAMVRGAMGSSCGSIMQGELVEAGFHQRGAQTWIVLAAPFAPPTTAQTDDVQAQVLALVNDARARPRRCGNESFAATRPVQLSARLQDVATAHAGDMANNNYFSHTGRDGSSVAQRADRAGYNWRLIAENIAAGQINADAAVKGWLKSPDHCANIMSPAYSEMGAAFAVNNRSSAGIYWAQVFGTTRKR